MKTKTLPGSKIHVVTMSAATDFECKPMEVPVDDNGRPFFTRCETDAHNNLRILLSPTSYVQFNSDHWRMVSNDEINAPIVQAVRDAS